MPIYHFNTENGHRVSDVDGIELTDLEAARREAVRLVGELIRDDPAEFWRTKSLKLTVTDAVGLSLFCLDLQAADAASICPPTSPGGW